MFLFFGVSEFKKIAVFGDAFARCLLQVVTSTNVTQGQFGFFHN